MRNQRVTQFWKNALESLPAEIRQRHALQFEAAERRELWLDALFEFGKRAKLALDRMLQGFKHHAPRTKNA
jgi:hypothetical protein